MKLWIDFCWMWKSVVLCQLRTEATSVGGANFIGVVNIIIIRHFAASSQRLLAAKVTIYDRLPEGLGTTKIASSKVDFLTGRHAGCVAFDDFVNSKHIDQRYPTYNYRRRTKCAWMTSCFWKSNSRHSNEIDLLIWLTKARKALTILLRQMQI